MQHDKESRDRLPVTAEIGSEGGSYADPANQLATFSGPDRPNVTPTEAALGEPPVASHLAPIDTMPAGGSVVGPTDGMLRYPTEPPSPPDATEGRRMGRRPWRAGLIGAAAGAAVAIGVARLRRRQEPRSGNPDEAGVRS